MRGGRSRSVDGASVRTPPPPPLQPEPLEFALIKDKSERTIGKKISKEALRAAKEIRSEFKDREVVVLQDDPPGHSSRRRVIPRMLYEDRMQVYDSDAGCTGVLKYASIRSAQ